MNSVIIAVPYDSGQRGWRMGAGPEHLLSQGLAEKIGAGVTFIEEADPFQAALAIAAEVRSAVENEALPIILGGNCIVTLGGLQGFAKPPALLWLDAHADFNTPETSPSGFLDGMALSIITGRTHGPRIVPDENIMMLGVRSIDEGEREPLSHVKTIRSSKELWNALASIEAEELYFHFDLDALDPSELVANTFATARGLSMHTVRDAIEAVKQNKRIGAVAFTAYDPVADTRNRGVDVVSDLVAVFLSV